MAGMVAAYELMKLGLKPVIYEASRMGGRLRSQAFEGADGVVAELGGMRFPVSSTAFYHYVDMLGLEDQTLPQPADARPRQHRDRSGRQDPLRTETGRSASALFQEVPTAWAEALEEGAHFTELQQAIRDRDVPRLKELWDRSCRCGTTAPSTTSSPPPKPSPTVVPHREVFGQVGFGTGGWDSDFPQLHAGNPARGDHRLRR